jgi:predicted DCC family thiol-disulfide oxidoreductase YuxK
MDRGTLSHPIILFDGECAFCDGTVNWVIDRDPNARFRFAALQSDPGRALAMEHGIDLVETDSLVVVSGGRARLDSSAAITIALHLSWPWRILSVVWLVPAPIRNSMYRLFARNRYRWFGRLDSCRILTLPRFGGHFLSGDAQESTWRRNEKTI